MLLAVFCYCAVRFVSDLVGNDIVGFPTRRLISGFAVAGCPEAVVNTVGWWGLLCGDYLDYNTI